MTAGVFGVVADGDRWWFHFCDRRLPAEIVQISDVELPVDLPPSRLRRVGLRFETGILLSIVWSSGTYSTNHGCLTDKGQPFDETPRTVEVGVLQDGELLGVLAWQTVDDVARTIDACNAGNIPVLRLEENGL